VVARWHAWRAERDRQVASADTESMNPRCVFFDFGGTLARQINTREDAIIASLVRLGYDVPPAQVGEALAAVRERYAGRSPHGLTFPAREEFFIGMYQDVAESLGFGREARKIGEYLWETQEDSFAVYSDAVPALEALRQAGMRLGIISNWDKLNLARVCRDLGIAAWFDVILPSAEAEADKPDPRIFTKALELAGVEAAAAVHVGDSYGADVQGAQGVDMTGILVQREAEPACDCPTVRRLDELPDLLTRL